MCKFPCRYFSFRKGTCDDRRLARVGGLPYWPRSQEWPICYSCYEPLTFLAQLDFRGIQCVGVEIPGEILTFFYCFTCQPLNGFEGCSNVSLLPADIADEELVSESDMPIQLELGEHGQGPTIHALTAWSAGEPGDSRPADMEDWSGVDERSQAGGYVEGGNADPGEFTNEDGDVFRFLGVLRSNKAFDVHDAGGFCFWCTDKGELEWTSYSY